MFRILTCDVLNSNNYESLCVEMCNMVILGITIEGKAMYWALKA